MTDPVIAAATNIGPTSAKLNGSVNPAGVDSVAYFEYGLTTSYGARTTDIPVGSGVADVPVSANISSLAPSTTYHARLALTQTAPPVGTLLWSPPTLSSPTFWNPTNANHSRSFGDSEDVYITLPPTPLVVGAGGSASLTIIGGRNIIIVGGEIRRDNVDTGGSPVVDDHYGIYLVRNCGVVHIEGVWVHGAGMAQPIVLQETRNDVHPTVQVQNCLLQAEHPVTAGIHTDAVQGIAGPDILRMYQNTHRSSGTAMQMQPYTIWTGHSYPVVGWDIRKADWITQLPHSDLSPQSYGLWKSASGNSTTPWPEYHEDIYYSLNTHHVQAAPPIYSANADQGGANEGGLQAWDPGDPIWTGITGDPITIGVRPGGDLVVAGVNCGLGYVSPGYT